VATGVQSGELIALLEIPEMVSEIAHARASFAIEESTCKRLEAIRKAEKSAVTDQDLDLAHAKRDMAEATLRRLETMKSYTEIRAPFDGSVTERFADPAPSSSSRRSSRSSTRPKCASWWTFPKPKCDSPDRHRGEHPLRRPSGQEHQSDHFPPGGRPRSDPPHDADRTRRSEPKRAILPGMFARVEPGGRAPPNVIVIPAKAVTISQNHSFVFINLGGWPRSSP
jgi:hypothetical protein